MPFNFELKKTFPMFTSSDLYFVPNTSFFFLEQLEHLKKSYNKTDFDQVQAFFTEILTAQKPIDPSMCDPYRELFTKEKFKILVAMLIQTHANNIAEAESQGIQNAPKVQIEFFKETHHRLKLITFLLSVIEEPDLLASNEYSLLIALFCEDTTNILGNIGAGLYEQFYTEEHPLLSSIFKDAKERSTQIGRKTMSLPDPSLKQLFSAFTNAWSLAQAQYLCAIGDLENTANVINVLKLSLSNFKLQDNQLEFYLTKIRQLNRAKNDPIRKLYSEIYATLKTTPPELSYPSSYTEKLALVKENIINATELEDTLKHIKHAACLLSFINAESPPHVLEPAKALCLQIDSTLETMNQGSSILISRTRHELKNILFVILKKTSSLENKTQEKPAPSKNKKKNPKEPNPMAELTKKLTQLLESNKQLKAHCKRFENQAAQSAQHISAEKDHLEATGTQLQQNLDHIQASTAENLAKHTTAVKHLKREKAELEQSNQALEQMILSQKNQQKEAAKRAANLKKTLETLQGEVKPLEDAITLLEETLKSKKATLQTLPAPLRETPEQQHAKLTLQEKVKALQDENLVIAEQCQDSRRKLEALTQELTSIKAMDNQHHQEYLAALATYMQGCVSAQQCLGVFPLLPPPVTYHYQPQPTQTMLPALPLTHSTSPPVARLPSKKD